MSRNELTRREITLVIQLQQQPLDKLCALLSGIFNFLFFSLLLADIALRCT